MRLKLTMTKGSHLKNLPKCFLGAAIVTDSWDLDSKCQVAKQRTTFPDSALIISLFVKSHADQSTQLFLQVSLPSNLKSTLAS